MKACEELGVSVFVHPWDMELGGRMKQYWLPWLVGKYFVQHIQVIMYYLIYCRYAW